MADASSLSWTPALERCQLTTVNVLVHLPIVSDNGQAFEFTHQRSTGKEQLLAPIVMLRPLWKQLESHWPYIFPMAMPPFLLREASIVSVWCHDVTWLCCTHWQSLDAVFLAAFPLWAHCVCMSQMLPYTGPVLGLCLQAGATGGPKRNLALTGLFYNWQSETSTSCPLRLCLSCHHVIM